MANNKIDRTIHSGNATSYTESSADFGTIKNRLKSLQPEKANDAGKAYSAVAKELADKARLLTEKHAGALTEAWGGDAAQKALNQLKQIHWTANELATKSTQSAQTMNWYGTEILQWYKDAGDHMSDGIFSTSGDDHEAQKMMTKLNGRTAQAQNGIPQTITTDLPTDHGEIGTPTNPGKPGGPGSGPGGPGTGPGSPSLPKDPFGNPPNSHTHLPTENYPTDPTHHTTTTQPPGIGVDTGGDSHLAGWTPPGGGGFPGGGGGGLGGDPLGGAGGGFPGGGGLGSGPGGLGAGSMGAGGLGTSGFGNAGAAAEQGGMGAGGRGMMPMGGHGQGEKERERSTWLTEDDDIWGDDGDAAPPLIG